MTTQDQAVAATVSTGVPPFRFGLMDDCRRVPDSPLPTTDVAATVEQAALTDALGLDQVWFTEHHFQTDGYPPAFRVALVNRVSMTEEGIDILIEEIVGFGTAYGLTDVRAPDSGSTDYRLER